GGFYRELKHAAARLDADLAEDRMRAPLDLVVERGVVERGELFRLDWLDHANQAGPAARQRHQRERSALGVEFRRSIVVRSRVGEIEGQRGLRIGATIAFDAGPVAAERSPAVGADDELHGEAVAALQPDRGIAFVRFDDASLVQVSYEGGQS